jgi:hypothetical protein
MLNHIKIWLKEWKKPKLKCERLGHKDRKRMVIIMKDDDSFFAGVEYLAEINMCDRCNKKSEPIIIEKMNSYTSISLPSKQWKELKTKTYTIIEYL